MCYIHTFIPKFEHFVWISTLSPLNYTVVSRLLSQWNKDLIFLCEQNQERTTKVTCPSANKQTVLFCRSNLCLIRCCFSLSQGTLLLSPSSKWCPSMVSDPEVMMRNLPVLKKFLSIFKQPLSSSCVWTIKHISVELYAVMQMHVWKMSKPFFYAIWAWGSSTL